MSWICPASLLLGSFADGSRLADAKDQKAAVAKALDAWHQAAADAKEDEYFALFAKDAVFLGTDAAVDLCQRLGLPLPLLPSETTRNREEEAVAGSEAEPTMPPS